MSELAEATRQGIKEHLAFAKKQNLKSADLEPVWDPCKLSQLVPIAQKCIPFLYHEQADLAFLTEVGNALHQEIFLVS